MRLSDSVIKILHVIAGLPLRAGGPTNAIYGMVRSLRAIEIEAGVATTDSAIWGNLCVPLGKRVIEEGVPIYYFRSPMLRKYGFSPTLTSWLKAHIGEYALVHIHGIFAHSTITAAVSGWKAGVSYIIRPSGELDPWPLRKNRLLKRTFLTLIGRRIVNRAAAIHATSEMEKASLNGLGVKVPVVTTPLGADLVSDSDVPPYEEFRRQHPGLAGKKLILFLSRIDSIKGVDLLLPALKRLREKRDDFVCVVAGSGAPSFENQVRRWVRDLDLGGSVMFCGFLDGQRKRAALRDADLFVLPSYHENFGVAVVEAMAMGLPVVVTDQVGIHREVAEYKAGLVTKCSIEELTQALLELLEDEALRVQMGENGKQLVREKFAWEKIALQLKALYQTILSSNG